MPFCEAIPLYSQVSAEKRPLLKRAEKSTSRECSDDNNSRGGSHHYNAAVDEKWVKTFKCVLKNLLPIKISMHVFENATTSLYEQLFVDCVLSDVSVSQPQLWQHRKMIPCSLTLLEYYLTILFYLPQR